MNIRQTSKKMNKSSNNKQRAMASLFIVAFFVVVLSFAASPINSVFAAGDGAGQAAGTAEDKQQEAKISAVLSADAPEIANRHDTDPDIYRRKVRVGYYTDNEDFQSGFSDDERKSGYAYAYLQEIAKITGWRYEYVYGTRDELLKQLAASQIDIMAGIRTSQAPDGRLRFPAMSMGSQEYHILVPSNRSDLKIGDIDSLNGLKIGVNKSGSMYAQLTDFLAKNKINAKVIPFATAFARLESFHHRAVDAIVSPDINTLQNVKTLVKIGTSPYYIAVCPDRPELVADINRAQQEIYSYQPDFNIVLRQKYYYRNNIRNEFNEDERAWLEQCKSINVGFLRDFLPYSGVDDKNGSAVGAITAAVESLGKYTGRNIKIVAYDNVPKMIDALKKGNIDAAFPVHDDLWFAEHEDFFSTEPLASDRMALINKGYNAEDIEEIATTSMTDSHRRYISSIYPDAEIKEYNNIEEIIAALNKGTVSGALVSSNNLNRYIENNDDLNGFNITYPDITVAYSMAARRTNPIFYAILNRSVALIDQDRINEALIDSTSQTANYSLKNFIRHNSLRAAGILGTFILLLVVNFIAYWRRTRRYNQQIAAALAHQEQISRKLKSANDLLENQMRIIKEQQGIITTDPLTQVNNRYQLEKYSSEILERHKNKTGTKIYLAILDLNKFKEVNDNFGHQAGDQALITVANALKASVHGTSAFIARFGGDEFVLIHEGADDKQINSIIEAFHARLREESQKLPYEISASVGIACHTDEDETFEELFNRADLAMYQDKGDR